MVRELSARAGIPLIEALSGVPPDLVRDYLGRRGVPRATADWKYFDPAHERGRERGLVWLRRDRVEGFLGLIPFRLTGGGCTRNAVWSCDWSVASPRTAPGVGVRLLSRAIRDNAPLLCLDGNENSARYLPRIARAVNPRAGVKLTLPLRAGAGLELAGRRVPSLARLTPALGELPLRRRGRRPAPIPVRCESGVSARIEPLLEQGDEVGWHPRYDLAHLEWFLGRCPHVVCHTFVAEGSRAAALLWRHADSRRAWRTVVWSAADSEDALGSVLVSARRFVQQQRGWALSTVVAESQRDTQTELRRAGFLRRPRRLPVYVCTEEERAPEGAERLSPISYLDTDLGCLY